MNDNTTLVDRLTKVDPQRLREQQSNESPIQFIELMDGVSPIKNLTFYREEDKDYVSLYVKKDVTFLDLFNNPPTILEDLDIIAQYRKDYSRQYDTPEEFYRLSQKVRDLILNQVMVNSEYEAHQAKIDYYKPLIKPEQIPWYKLSHNWEDSVFCRVYNTIRAQLDKD